MISASQDVAHSAACDYFIASVMFLGIFISGELLRRNSKASSAHCALLYFEVALFYLVRPPVTSGNAGFSLLWYVPPLPVELATNFVLSFKSLLLLQDLVAPMSSHVFLPELSNCLRYCWRSMDSVCCMSRLLPVAGISA